MKLEYMQYGCGLSAPETWLNFDCSPTLRFGRLPLIGRCYAGNAGRIPANALYGDIVQGLPCAPASFTGIYSSHVLEHLALDDFQTALKHTFRYLKPGGTFRLVVPDLERLAQSYLEDKSPQAAIRFMEKTGLGKKCRPRGLGGLARTWFGNSAHLWMWDEKAMAQQLSEHGFKDIRRAAFGDAEDQNFTVVEERRRFAGCLAMQCRR